MRNRAVTLNKILRPDSKGRVTLGAYAKGVSAFHIIVDDWDRIILEPYVEIPAREKWLFDNPRALKKVKEGLIDSAAGRASRRGSFAKYLDETDD
jgi:hypothetical protein